MSAAKPAYMIVRVRPEWNSPCLRRTAKGSFLFIPIQGAISICLIACAVMEKRKEKRRNEGTKEEGHLDTRARFLTRLLAGGPRPLCVRNGRPLCSEALCMACHGMLSSCMSTTHICAQQICFCSLFWYWCVRVLPEPLLLVRNGQPRRLVAQVLQRGRGFGRRARPRLLRVLLFRSLPLGAFPLATAERVA